MQTEPNTSGGGVVGSFGPNCEGYMHMNIVEAAERIKKAQQLYSEGHYAFSNAKVIPKDHPLRIAMEQLAILDKELAMYANKKPDSEKFSTYEPPEENKHRWDTPKYIDPLDDI